MNVVAIIGCGRIANYAHLPALNKLDNVRIKYACDIIKSKAEKAKLEYSKVENVIVDYHDALNDKEVDTVFVLVPNYEHKRITIDALKAGKNVLCEKPIALNYEDALEMQKVAKNAGKILNIGVNNRYNAAVNTVKKYCEDGTLGHIYHVESHFFTTRSIPGLGGPFTTKKLSGGGVLIDWGVHILDLIQYLVGHKTLKSVSASTSSELAKNMKEYKYGNMWAEDTADIEHGVNDVEEFVSCFARYDGYTLSLTGGWATNIPADEFYIDIYGSKAGIRLYYVKQTFKIFSGETLEVTESNVPNENHYDIEDKMFIDSVESGIPNRGHIDEVIDIEKLIDLIYQSAEEEKEIRL